LLTSIRQALFFLYIVNTAGAGNKTFIVRGRLALPLLCLRSDKPSHNGGVVEHDLLELYYKTNTVSD